ncbi:MAG: aminotransferase class I/II-fold pyridoxal phosphate-dependent enzyme [Janthinobacterium lividum]
MLTPHLPLGHSPPAHGGPDARGKAPHDFSTNGNACGPYAPVVDALRAVDATHYPDPRYTALRERLAAFHGVDPARIFVAASASEFIFRITAAVARSGGRSVQLPRHSYGDYARAASGFGLDVRDTGSDDPAEPFLADADHPSLVWHCDPSSPLGRRTVGLGRLIDELPMNVTCVLDLAYEPLRLVGSLDLGARQRGRVWQLWTPNKALGLTGIRAAYAISPSVESFAGSAAARESSVAEHVEILAPSWPVSAHGVALLEGWAEAGTRQWLLESRNVLREWKSAQIALCGSLGWVASPSVANFFCVRPGGKNASVDTLAMRLRAAGIKVRDTTSFGLPGHLRLAVLDPGSQAALAHALQ